MDERILAQADHFLNVTKYIFQNRGFCFSTAFLIGNSVETIKLDLSTDEKKSAYAGLVKKRFYESEARYLVVIHPACITKLSVEDMLDAEEDSWPTVIPGQDNTAEGLLVFISSRKEGEVWQVPFTRNSEGIEFGEKEVMKSIVSENWMINPNKRLATQLN